MNLDRLKLAASGRWPELLADVGGIPSDLLDGRHHPCPRCGGTDRFRLIDVAAGAVLCNSCFHEHNGDGIAAIGWARGWTFQDAVLRLAERLGVDVQENGGGNGAPRSRRPRPDDQLNLRGFNPALVFGWTRS